ncbi:MAG: hypothetical protein WDO13_06135 [Verrucomicrobiota bacterium]
MGQLDRAGGAPAGVCRADTDHEQPRRDLPADLQRRDRQSRRGHSPALDELRHRGNVRAEQPAPDRLAIFRHAGRRGHHPIASSGDAGATPDSTGHGGGGPEQVEESRVGPERHRRRRHVATPQQQRAPSSEVVWNNSSGASGGGPSRHFSRPSWQTGTGVSGSMREVPDVASAADPSNGGFLILNGSEFSTGGTSWSAPTWPGSTRCSTSRAARRACRPSARWRRISTC